MKRNTKGTVPAYGFQEGQEEKAISSSDSWRTPQPIYDLINAEFHFEVDLAADDKNHKCDLYYTEQDDALKHEWDKASFANYPYSNPTPWFFKAWESSIHYQKTIVLFAKVATSENYWVQTAKYAQVRFLAGRIKFWDENNTPHYGATFGSALVIFDPKLYNSPTMSCWDYRGEKPVRLF